MERTIEKPKRLYYLEYTDWVFYYLPDPFEVVGFKCKGSYWTPDDPNRLVGIVLPALETWKPDIIFWRFRPMLNPNLPEEPEEWLALCQHLRHHPVLHRTKIMAVFSGTQKPTSTIKAEWSQRYDFYDWGPLRVVKHAKVAKELVGEKIQGFEGVNNDYLPDNGIWTISNEEEQGRINPDAEGAFTRKPLTHLLMMDAQGKPNWVMNGIQANQLTYIVYIIKDLAGWQKGLNQLEIERLVRLARPECQLLIGVNDVLLQAGSKTVNQVLQQAERAGRWKIFINEHMWYERSCTSRPPESVEETFERIVYQGDEAVDGWWDLMTM